MIIPSKIAYGDPKTSTIMEKINSIIDCIRALRIISGSDISAEEHPTGTTLMVRAKSGIRSSSPAAKEDKLITEEETTVTTSYTADWNVAQIHRIKLSAGQTCVTTISNLPMGATLLIAVNNASGGILNWNGESKILAGETDNYVLCFVKYGTDIKMLGDKAELL